jgi:hypothetical protein
MDPFKTASKLSIATIIFGVLALLLGWSITEAAEPVAQFQLSVIALVFLNLFFYALSRDKVAELEEKMAILADGKHERKAKFIS